ncbi:aminotransferase class V-fold PLP-dependent enzyme [Agrobacterium pusense]|uniref:Cysteine desulfurase n=1 Tax=Agrobacterium pusense TaxID=648995 RepID=U4Q7G8_9HYPH|nr:aminotransferase class V-fold PLP-dependent enzyme [Agrobacterium pusense]CDI12022.1 cysteine desulfurase (Nitrogenase metalloclusters biosynthesis protein nifS) [Agrobacterium pusense]
MSIYLDNNATTRVDSEVLQAMLPFFADQFGNPSLMHDVGAAAGAAMKRARQQLRALIGAKFDHEIIFTTGGTESNNTAILSALDVMSERTEILTSAVEHPAVLALCGHLEDTRGIKVHRIPVDQHGRLDVDAYRAALTPRVAILSIKCANNETGTIFPVARLSEMAKKVGVLYILYIKCGVPSHALLKGGHQQPNRRAGTENTPGIVGLGKEAELALERMDEENTWVKSLRDRLEKGLLERVPKTFVTGDPLARLPNTINVAFEGIGREAMQFLLNRHGIACAFGSACSSRSSRQSHVLEAINVPHAAGLGAVRLSFSCFNGEEDVDQVLQVILGIVKKLRGSFPSVRQVECGG